MLGRESDPLRLSDVAPWGGIALVCVLLAVLSLGVSSIVPPDVLGFLHRSRGEIDAAVLMQRFAGLDKAIADLVQENTKLQQRLAAAEGQSAKLGERLGALHADLPKLIAAAVDEATEAAPPVIDTRTTTAGTVASPAIFPAEGGSVSVREVPLLEAMAAAAGAEQPMPPAATSTAGKGTSGP